VKHGLRHGRYGCTNREDSDQDTCLRHAYGGFELMRVLASTAHAGPAVCACARVSAWARMRVWRRVLCARF
jgi:hypothetical protein